MALHKPTHFTTKQDVSQLHSAAAGDTGEGDAPLGAALADGTASGKFVTPSNLTESYVIVSARDKALAALHLVFSSLAAAPAGSVVLVFTGSIPATHRLARLLQLHGLGRSDISADADGSHTDSISRNSVAEFSSGLRQELRSGIIAAAAVGRVRVLVSSDATARGLDLPNVAATVSYDPAGSIRTYVHRVGRAARAGRPGAAHTILTKKQLKHFLDMMQTLRADYMAGPEGSPKVTEAQLPPQAFSAYVARYKRALAQVPALLAAESRGDVEAFLPVPPMQWVQGEGEVLQGHADKVSKPRAKAAKKRPEGREGAGADSLDAAAAAAAAAAAPATAAGTAGSESSGSSSSSSSDSSADSDSDSS
jgi:ATP-dependent RNA helicase DDX51/DBP6